MMRYILIVIIFSVSFSLNGSDISGIVKGKVVDNSTGEPLPGVYVIYGKNLGTTTDKNGLYIIITDFEKLRITFQFVGYESITKEIVIKSNETTELDVGLEMKIREIDQIVVSANKTDQKVAELTVSMDIIKTSFLSNNHITDAQELINKIPGIEVMDGQASIRGGSGFSYGVGSRVLALIDGLPVLSADAGNIKWQFLPLENLSQIEIIKGASSVLYGSSALNGIINFRTADATNIPVTQFFTETGIYGKPKNRNWIWWDTPRVFTSASFSHLQKFGRTDIGFGSNLLIDEGYRRLNGEKLARASLRLKHFNSKVEGLTYGLNLNAGYTIKRDFVLWENADSGALKQNESATIELHGDFLAINPYISLKKSDRYRHDLRMQIQSSRNRFPESKKNNSNAISAFSEYQLWYRLSKFLDLTAGASENYSLVTSNFFGDHTGLNVAGFAQFEIRPLYRLKAVAGLRVENNSLDGKNDKVVPVFRAGLNWQAADYTFLRASVGQGYRYPSIAEKYATTTLGSVTILPSPGIVPESGWSSEAGIKQGILLGKMRGQADFSLFMSQNVNMIEYFLAQGDGVTGFKATNIEQSRVYGGELEFMLNGSIGNINTTISGGYTYIYPVEFNKMTNKNTGNYLKYRRKHSGKISLNTSWKKFESDLSLYAKSKILRIDKFFTDDIGEGILPGFPDYWQKNNTGYYLIDGTIGYKLNSQLTLSFALKNITNTEYMGRPGDIQPQRNFSIRLSGKF
ncbi:MAG: TonB-dependent receptor [Bacteroidia bacterium]|nr:TonB-dependent receptor [Bacteroidia bacterium]